MSVDVSADVQAFVANGSTNFGWVLINDSTNGWDFATSEDTEFSPPTLTVKYGYGALTPIAPPTRAPVPAPVLPPAGNVYRPGELTVIKYE